MAEDGRSYLFLETVPNLIPTVAIPIQISCLAGSIPFRKVTSQENNLNNGHVFALCG